MTTVRLACSECARNLVDLAYVQTDRMAERRFQAVPRPGSSVTRQRDAFVWRCRCDGRTHALTWRALVDRYRVNAPLFGDAGVIRVAL